MVVAGSRSLLRAQFEEGVTMAEKDEQLQAAAASKGVGGYCRHVFLCTGPSCCTQETGLEAWEKLKLTLKEQGLTAGPNACYRTKVGCLRICCHGPTVVVYPEGTWYSGMTAERIPEFVQRHLIEGRPVEEWVFARNPLPASAITQR
jgi:(2Fe-2S) ferredoxin